jgi:hypothetical protein
MNKNTAILNRTNQEFESGCVSLIDGHIVSTYTERQAAHTNYDPADYMNQADLRRIATGDYSGFWIEANHEVCGVDDVGSENIKKEILKQITLL